VNSAQKQNIMKEGSAVLKACSGRISKELAVFYNPLMELNRTISVLLLKSLNRKKMQIAEPMAGTGIRCIRFLLELDKSIIDGVHINDASLDAVKSIRANLKLNKIKNNFKIYSNDASIFLLNSKGFDYIDIDPFGTPTPFIDAAMKRLARNGVLAVTATDTAALSGTSPKACLRKYWALPKKDSIMHETGLRILIRRIQLIGASYSKALTPVFSYAKDHYMRAFFLCEKSKEKCDEIIKQHKIINGAGPVWAGRLWCTELVKKMAQLCKDEKTKKFLATIYEESKISAMGFYDIPQMCKKEKIEVPGFDYLFERIRKSGYAASRTHFEPMGIKSRISEEKLVKILRPD